MCTSQAALLAVVALVHVACYLLLLSFHVLLLAARPRAALVLAHLDNLLGTEVLLQRDLAVTYVYYLFLQLVVVFGLVLWWLVGCRVRVVVRAQPLP